MSRQASSPTCLLLDRRIDGGRSTSEWRSVQDAIAQVHDTVAESVLLQ